MLSLRVREVAQEKGISMSKLSRTADVNYKTIQAIWRDPYHGLNTKTLERLAKALGVPTPELIEDVPGEEVAAYDIQFGYLRFRFRPWYHARRS